MYPIYKYYQIGHIPFFTLFTLRKYKSRKDADKKKKRKSSFLLNYFSARLARYSWTFLRPSSVVKNSTYPQLADVGFYWCISDKNAGFGTVM